MNNKLAALVLLASASIALALDPSAPVVREVGGVIVQTAERIPAVFGSTYPYDCAGDEAWVRDGWRNRTAQEIAAEQAAKDAAAAQAAANATLPQVFPSGVAVIDPATGHHIELIPTGDGLPVIGAQVSSSPLSKEQRDAMKAERKAAHDALKAKAKDAKNDKDKIAALMEAVFGKQ